MEYMSQDGFDKLVAELNRLEKESLPEVIDAISEARDKGDLSENAEYHAAKHEQGRILGRIKFLQNVLAHTRVLKTRRSLEDGVQLLCKVGLTNLKTSRKVTYIIASPHEANLRDGKISIKSPIAQALLGKHEGDEVEVKVPAGIVKLRIDSISL